MRRSPVSFVGSKGWLDRHVNDAFVKQAKEQDLRSRAYFKLDEVQAKHKIIRPGAFIVDLGCAPGGWSLAAARILFSNRNAGSSSSSSSGHGTNSNKGLIIGIDLLDMQPIDNVTFIRGDFLKPEVQANIIRLSGGRKADLILSDMLQNTSGHHATDHFRSIDLCLTALDFSTGTLDTNGSMLCKYLQGSEERDMVRQFAEVFGDVRVVKPRASRRESSEAFLLALKKKRIPVVVAKDR